MECSGYLAWPPDLLLLVDSSLQTDIDGRGFDPEHQLQYKEPIEVFIFTSTDTLLSPKMGDYVKKRGPTVLI